jgi:hypothetical protein
MPNWFWFVFPFVGVLCYFLILYLQKVEKRVAVLVGIAEAILTYILSVTGFEMRIHPTEIKPLSYIITSGSAVLMVALFYIKGKPEKKE